MLRRIDPGDLISVDLISVDLIMGEKMSCRFDPGEI